MAPWIVLAAMMLDAAFGEPPWLWSRVPHPAVLMGRCVDWADRCLNNKTRIAGVVAVCGLVVLAGTVGWLISRLGFAAEILAIAILLAQRSLVDHVAAVADALDHALPEARTAVGMIVSRNTETMEQADVARAAVESGAENLSDGVIAPALWALVGGVPGIMIYKFVNTADSMIGYRTDTYEQFGWAAARLDDVLNWVPARLTAVLLWCVGGTAGPWSDIIGEARNHKSPNAGWPEAVLARSLKIALAGPRVYHGTTKNLPWVNPDGLRDIGATQIRNAVTELWKAWALFAICLLIGSIGTL